MLRRGMQAVPGGQANCHGTERGGKGDVAAIWATTSLSPPCRCIGFRPRFSTRNGRSGEVLPTSVAGRATILICCLQPDPSPRLRRFATDDPIIRPYRSEWLRPGPVPVLALGPSAAAPARAGIAEKRSRFQAHEEHRVRICHVGRPGLNSPLSWEGQAGTATRPSSQHRAQRGNRWYKKIGCSGKFDELFRDSESRPPAAGRIVRIWLIHRAGAAVLRLPDDRIKPRRHLAAAWTAFASDKARVIRLTLNVLELTLD